MQGSRWAAVRVCAWQLEEPELGVIAENEEYISESEKGGWGDVRLRPYVPLVTFWLWHQDNAWICLDGPASPSSALNLLHHSPRHSKMTRGPGGRYYPPHTGAPHPNWPWNSPNGRLVISVELSERTDSDQSGNSRNGRIVISLELSERTDSDQPGTLGTDG